MIKSISLCFVACHFLFSLYYPFFYDQTQSSSSVIEYAFFAYARVQILLLAFGLGPPFLNCQDQISFYVNVYVRTYVWSECKM